jgi:hypothetical protein
MLIGLWDWGRVEGHLRSGWRSREVQAAREGEALLKWHLNACKAGGMDVDLRSCTSQREGWVFPEILPTKSR